MNATVSLNSMPPHVTTDRRTSPPRAHSRSSREVAPSANKIQIKDAIQRLFKVTVVDVNTMRYRGKERRMGRGHAKLHNWKKAVITLKEGDQIQFFDSEG